MKKPRVAIVGGGPGGLTLARILHVRGIDAAVFEREAHAASRPQGGSLDMHEESGRHAIALAGLTRAFEKIARYEDQEMRVYDKHGTLHYVDTDTSEAKRPEVDRGHLREMLLECLAPGTVRWDHELRTVEPSDDGTVDLHFANGTSERFDLVVGADGAWSRLRPSLSDAKPAYSGVTMFEFGIDDADARHPDSSALVGRGLAFALGDEKAIIGHRDADAHLGCYAGLRVPEDRMVAGSIDRPTPAALREMLLSHFADWSDDLRALIVRCGDPIAPRPIYALPAGHRWQHRYGLTLIGDAAHVMSPFGGEGANLAMLDAADLAVAIADNDAWDAAVARCEGVQATRAEVAAEGARTGIDEAFSANALEHMLAHMNERRG